MTAPSPHNASSRPPLWVTAALALAAVAGFFLWQALGSSTTGTNAVATNAAATLALPQSNTAGVPVPTTAPIPLPQPTAVPTSAPVVAPTAIPLATPTPVPPPTETPVPPTPVPEEPTALPVVVADEDSARLAQDQVSPTEVAPTAVETPEATPTSAAVDSAALEVADPTAAPTSTVEPALVADATPTPEAKAGITVATPDPTPDPTPTATATAAPTVIAVTSTADMQLYVLGKINAVRASVDLPPVELAAEVSSISVAWSAKMAEAGNISHRPSDELGAMLPSGWRYWGENVATAPDIFWAQSALEGSPGHYRNMVEPSFTHVGIGVVVANGSVWLTQNFVSY